MDVPVIVWVLSILGVLGLVAFDFLAHIRTPHEPTIREAAIWTSIYLSLAVMARPHHTNPDVEDHGKRKVD